MSPRTKFNLFCLAILLAVAVEIYSEQPSTPKPGPSVASTRAVIVHETADQNPKFAALINSLRQGEPAKFFSDKGRSLDVWDKDAKDENGKLRIAPEDIDGLKLPAILGYSKRGKLTFKQSLESDATAESIVALAKKKGL